MLDMFFVGVGVALENLSEGMVSAVAVRVGVVMQMLTMLSEELCAMSVADVSVSWCPSRLMDPSSKWLLYHYRRSLPWTIALWQTL